MRLTFINDMGQSFIIEIDPQMELENIMALLEAESGIPIGEQSISFKGQDLSNPKATMTELGVGDDAMLMIRRKVVVGGRTIEQDAEMMRLQLLGDPTLMEQLREAQPEIAAAAQNNPARFAELLRQTRSRQSEAELQQQREIERLNADPFDVEAQRRIEEAIRQQAVMDNMEHALEYAPESFGRGRDVDLLFGLDMLKAHQAIIDLEKSVLRIQGREVKFLAEHELPDKARMFEMPVEDPASSSAAGTSMGRPQGAGSGQSHFPGGGNTLGSPPSGAGRGAVAAQRPAPPSPYPEADIQTLINLGATRETAIRALDAVGGNVEYAASVLFNF
ncbi:hypothetical protein BD410DRAFT_736209 [Rickenella mellea]|uniref:DNA damage-inducible protein 1 n=1 Tax=Rickenella mellea TaxID=50990 RepID=A0A4V3AZJ3_9AGAM|nr:hypothetical protein BD410DRAFT_736209 [Rickenella mellea]